MVGPEGKKSTGRGQAGQPLTSLATKFTYCARSSTGSTVTRTVTFGSTGKVTKIS